MISEVDSIAYAAHELKAPLAVLRQLAFAISEAEAPTAKQQLSREMIKVSDRALRQVNDLAKIARLEDGLFAMEPVSVRGLCDEVSHELARLFASHQRELKTKYQNRSRLVIANRELLYSIIYNFCSNAIHYSASGTRSELKVSERQGKIRVAVRDFGPALPLSLWRELKQSGQLTRPSPIAMRPGSSGLGLYIASNFAKYMHADLGATRHRDGSSFFIDLPISTQVSLL